MTPCMNEKACIIADAGKIELKNSGKGSPEFHLV